jgi:predicted dienelactone hydrolase
MTLGTRQGLLAGALMLLAALASSAAASEKTVTERIEIAGLSAVVWRPAGTARYPLLVFSHGFTACADQAPLLGKLVAAAGYVVAAPEHRDSPCAGGGYAPPEAPFGKPAQWTEKTYRARGQDIARLIDALEASPEWAARLDFSHIGLMGHSLGGHVVLALAGALPSWRRDDVRAVIAMAPLIGPLLAKGKLEEIRAPVMYQVGSRDAGTTALVKRKGGAYERTRSAYLVEIKGADHFAWAAGDAALQRNIAALSIAFLNAELKGMAFARPGAAAAAIFRKK